MGIEKLDAMQYDTNKGINSIYQSNVFSVHGCGRTGVLPRGNISGQSVTAVYNALKSISQRNN